MCKGNLMVDALIGMMIVVLCVQMVSMSVQSYHKVESEKRFFSNWQVEEYCCEIWCESFWFLDD